MISQGFLGNLGSMKSTPQSSVRAYDSPVERDEGAVNVRALHELVDLQGTETPRFQGPEHPSIH